MVRSHRDNLSSTSASATSRPRTDRFSPPGPGEYYSPSSSPPLSPPPPSRPRTRRRPRTPETPPTPPPHATGPGPALSPPSPSAPAHPSSPSSPAAPPMPAAAEDYVDVFPASDLEIAENGRLVSREDVTQQLIRVYVEGRELSVLLGHASAEWWNSPATRAQRAFVRAQLAAAGRGAFRVARNALVGDGGSRVPADDFDDDGFEDRPATAVEERSGSLVGYYARGAVRGLTGGVFGGVTPTPAASSTQSNRPSEDFADDDFDMGMFDAIEAEEADDDQGTRSANQDRPQQDEPAAGMMWDVEDDEAGLGLLPFGDNDEW
ncbi:hypothetical protein NKR23_g10964 [Pleurostoma richardsiae]|uniref:Uncharacterized protein n=1 Tax=Pleurostoma richardsiae TaxID=41990 RepID=A0AA38RD12_9PEZI|nr:hypothetical protein NKR23_g10964 [Pleurostoma richardsiae]